MPSYLLSSASNLSSFLHPITTLLFFSCVYYILSFVFQVFSPLHNWQGNRHTKAERSLKIKKHRSSDKKDKGTQACVSQSPSFPNFLCSSFCLRRQSLRSWKAATLGFEFSSRFHHFPRWMLTPPSTWCILYTPCRCASQSKHLTWLLFSQNEAVFLKSLKSWVEQTWLVCEYCPPVWGWSYYFLSIHFCWIYRIEKYK